MLSTVGTTRSARDPSEPRRDWCPQLTMPAAEGQDVKVWQKVFQELIHQVRPWHQWTLTLDNSLIPNTLQPGWAQYQQQVFAR